MTVPPVTVMSGDRDAELSGALAAVRERIRRSCADAGREPAETTLVVVTKTFPADDVARLVRLGVHDVGENRDQEAAEKAEALSGSGLRWHFVGQLQRNKAASVARYASVVHSLDRLGLVAALQRGAAAAGRQLEVLVQVDLREAERAGGGAGGGTAVASAGRGGATPEAVRAIADEVAASSALVLRGVMAVAPLVGDPAPAFARLAYVSRALRADHPQASWISAGMSGDLEQALAAGATHLRVGSAILGRRPPLQ